MDDRMCVGGRVGRDDGMDVESPYRSKRWHCGDWDGRFPRIRAGCCDKKQTQPPRLEDDLQRLMGKGAKVYVVTDDVAERGLERTDLIAGLEPMARSGIAKLYGDYDQIWHW